MSNIVRKRGAWGALLRSPRRSILLPALETRNRHLPVELHAELVGDGQGFFAVAAGLNLQVPAEQIIRMALAQVNGILAQLRRGLCQTDVDAFSFTFGQAVPDLQLDRLGFE